MAAQSRRPEVRARGRLEAFRESADGTADDRSVRTEFRFSQQPSRIIGERHYPDGRTLALLECIVCGRQWGSPRDDDGLVLSAGWMCLSRNCPSHREAAR